MAGTARSRLGSRSVCHELAVTALATLIVGAEHLTTDPFERAGDWNIPQDLGFLYPTLVLNLEQVWLKKMPCLDHCTPQVQVSDLGRLVDAGSWDPRPTHSGGL